MSKQSFSFYIDVLPNLSDKGNFNVKKSMELHHATSRFEIHEYMAYFLKFTFVYIS